MKGRAFVILAAVVFASFLQARSFLPDEDFIGLPGSFERGHLAPSAPLISRLKADADAYGPSVLRLFSLQAGEPIPLRGYLGGLLESPKDKRTSPFRKEQYTGTEKTEDAVGLLRAIEAI